MKKQKNGNKGKKINKQMSRDAQNKDRKPSNKARLKGGSILQQNQEYWQEYYSGFCTRKSK